MSDTAGRSPSGKKNKKTTISVVHIVRVRCKEEHPNPWLADLGVIWTPVDPNKKGAPTYYGLWTDASGYLSEQVSSDEATPAIPLIAPGQKYEFYFVRHPDKDYLREVITALGEVRKGWNWDPRALFGPRESSVEIRGPGAQLSAEIEETGKAKGKPVKEAVLRVPEDPRLFYPLGSPAYGNWTLYRDMPHAECEPVRSQVGKLQNQLGNLGYIVGGPFTPYKPSKPALPKSKEAPSRLWLEGNFSTYVWNAVLLLQRNALAGMAHDKKTNSDVAVKPAKLLCDGVVDTSTAQAIATWTASGLRKPGHVLVLVQTERNGVQLWMRDDAAGCLEKWRGLCTAWGMKKEHLLRANSTFRQAEADVAGAGFGRAQLSIHKTGMAIDLNMRQYEYTVETLPVLRVREDVGDRVRWRIYILANRVSSPPDPKKASAYYKAEISPWVYRKMHPEGGFVGPPLQAPAGQAFLDLTALGEEAGFTRISSFKDHWFDYLPERIQLGSFAAFDQLMRRIYLHGKYAKAGGVVAPIYQSDTPATAETEAGAAEAATPTVGVMAGSEHKGSADAPLPEEGAAPGEIELAWASLQNDIKLLEAWYQVTYKSQPTPALEIDPKRKADVQLLRQFMRTLNKRPFTITVDGKDTEIEMGPKVEWPASAFVLAPRPATLAVTAGKMYRFPEIAGEAIGLEWWHHEVPKAVRGRSWLGLMEEIGWTTEGLDDQAREQLYMRKGLGYNAKSMAEAQKG